MNRLATTLCAAVLLAGCGSIEESDPKPQLTAVSAPGTDFGQTLIGTRKQLDFRLRNSDAGLPRVKPLENIAPSVTGAGLTLSHTCPATLEEGDECFLSVFFQPSAAATLAGELRVTSNAAAVALSVSGSAVTVLSPAAAALAFVGSTDGNFGTVVRGGSKTLAYVVRNIGNADGAITITAPTGSGWTAAEDCPDTLAAGASCNVSVTFAPTATGLSVPTPLVVSVPYHAGYGGLALPLTGTGG